MNNLDFTSFEVSKVCQKLTIASTQLMGDAAGWAWICDAINKAQYMLMQLQKRDYAQKNDIAFYEEELEHLEEFPFFKKVEQRMWVPVDVSTPEEGERILVTIEDFDGDKYLCITTYREGLFKTLDALAWRYAPDPWDEVRRKTEEKADLKGEQT